MNYTKFYISKDGDTIVNIPLILAIIMAIMAPWVACVGFLAALVTGCTFGTSKRVNTAQPWHNAQHMNGDQWQ